MPGISCSSSKKVDKQEETTSEDQPSDPAPVDLPNTDRLAPGTALVRVAEIKAIDTERGDESIMWVLTINEVLGYGSATPPLAIGNELEINATNYFKNVPSDPRKQAQKKELVCLINHQQVMGPDASSNWSLVEIFEQQQ
ncbi:hypothetical protein NC796_00680 [Aliifodinibius sp. S!AR15-10]|nr:hypothetical protein [Aliifodinibius sp. S!AR15-10]